MLTINKISKKYGNNTVLKNFSYSFPKIGIVTVTGDSGAGKTTLLNIIAGLEKQDEGEIINTYSSLSYAFQEYCLFPWLTVKENLELIIGKNEGPDNKIIEWLEKLELSDSAAKYPDELSGGMKQRVSLARALAYPSDIVLLDEPFKGLDKELHNNIYSIIKKESETRLVILVTHDTNDVSDINIKIDKITE